MPTILTADEIPNIYPSEGDFLDLLCPRPHVSSWVVGTRHAGENGENPDSTWSHNPGWFDGELHPWSYQRLYIADVSDGAKVRTLLRYIANRAGNYMEAAVFLAGSDGEPLSYDPLCCVRAYPSGAIGREQAQNGQGFDVIRVHSRRYTAMIVDNHESVILNNKNIFRYTGEKRSMVKLHLFRDKGRMMLKVDPSELHNTLDRLGVELDSGGEKYTHRPLANAAVVETQSARLSTEVLLTRGVKTYDLSAVWSQPPNMAVVNKVLDSAHEQSRKILEWYQPIDIRVEITKKAPAK